MNNKIHFSVDDVLNSFLWLENNRKNSIFDAKTFFMAKWLYEYYGVTTTYNCFYKTVRGTLKNVSDRYRNEIENAGFLFFSFHGLDENTDYNNFKYERVKNDYLKTTEELARIAGESALSKIIRLHYFQGNSETVKALENLGVELLLTADDNRGSYDLTAEEEMKAKRGIYHRNGGKIGYISTDIRIERLSKQQIQLFEPVEGKAIVTFTHERYMMLNETKEKLSVLLERVGEI